MIVTPFDRFDERWNGYGTGSTIVTSCRLHNQKNDALYRSQVVTVPTEIVFNFGSFGVVYRKNCDRVRLGCNANLSTVQKVSSLSEHLSVGSSNRRRFCV